MGKKNAKVSMFLLSRIIFHIFTYKNVKVETKKDTRTSINVLKLLLNGMCIIWQSYNLKRYFLYFNFYACYKKLMKKLHYAHKNVVLDLEKCQ